MQNSPIGYFLSYLCLCVKTNLRSTTFHMKMSFLNCLKMAKAKSRYETEAKARATGHAFPLTVRENAIFLGFQAK